MMTKKRLIIFIISVAIIFSLYLLPVISANVNSNLQKTFDFLKGEEKPDSNIILIHITSNDVENLGDWPLKRSYYALLINYLTELDVKKIGLEIFLSENLASQNIYNSVLSNSIQESGRVILSSVSDVENSIDTVYTSSGIKYPTIKNILPGVYTGHINFIEEYGIIIPSEIAHGDQKELSFSQMIADHKLLESSIRINFVSSWETITNYSMLEFFELYENKSAILSEFKNKIILIGVSDPLIAKTIKTTHDNEMPGLAIHAFAVDNILNSRNFIYRYFNYSTHLFSALIIILSFLVVTPRHWLMILLIGTLIFFLLFSHFHLLFDYAAFLIPLFSIMIVTVGFLFFESKKKLVDSKIESDLFRKKLQEKEQNLDELKHELSKKSVSEKAGLQLKIDELESEISSLKSELDADNESFTFSGEYENFEGIIFKSKNMAKIKDLIKKVAPENATVLITGESGSGKELVANAIHNLSLRKNNNFVPVNCAALPDNLLESELFGHVKGAFTDAVNDKIGRFEEANNGTLFLDEIGETSENFQVKLLRVLQKGDFQKVGSSVTQHADVRIVAATNKNLNQLVNEKKFREDLFYRLNVINIELPSLSDRKEDIEILAQYFANREDENIHFSKAVIENLVRNEWKGNIRELESTIKRAIIFAKSENRQTIKLKDLPENLAKINKDDLEKWILESLREKSFSHSSIIDTSKELGVNRTVVAENFRGIFFKIYSQNSFDLDKSVEIIAETSDIEIKSKVRSKFQTYISNIKNDLESYVHSDFKEIKKSFNSKYRNLPQKYHKYFDMIIQKMM